MCWWEQPKSGFLWILIFESEYSASSFIIIIYPPHHIFASLLVLITFDGDQVQYYHGTLGPLFPLTR